MNMGAWKKRETYKGLGDSWDIFRVPARPKHTRRTCALLSYLVSSSLLVALASLLLA